MPAAYPPAWIPDVAAPRNLVNLDGVAKGYAARSVLRDVTLGVAAGERIGVVGRNGDGKSTLLRLIAGAEAPDAGTVTLSRGLAVALLGQGDELHPARTVREELLGGMADHEWQADPARRAGLGGLLGGIAPDSPIAPPSRRERPPGGPAPPPPAPPPLPRPAPPA